MKIIENPYGFGGFKILNDDGTAPGGDCAGLYDGRDGAEAAIQARLKAEAEERARQEVEKKARKKKREETRAARV